MSALRLCLSRTQLSAFRALHSSSSVLQAEKSALEVRLRDGLKNAMKSKDKPALACLKAIIADVTYNQKSSANPNEPMDESAVMQAIRKGIQNRNVAAESYAPTSPSPHPENYENLQKEIELLQSYLPTAPSSESVKTSIDEIIASLEENVRSSKGVQGVVMKTLWDRLGEAAGGLDRKEVGKSVAEALKK